MHGGGFATGLNLSLRRVPAHVLSPLPAGEAPTEAAGAMRAAPKLDLATAWMALHAVLTGDESPTSNPLSQALYGAHFDGKRAGYSGAEEVQAISRALQKLKDKKLDRRWWAWGERTLKEHLDGMRAFYAAAAEEGQGVALTFY